MRLADRWVRGAVLCAVVGAWAVAGGGARGEDDAAPLLAASDATVQPSAWESSAAAPGDAGGAAIADVIACGYGPTIADGAWNWRNTLSLFGGYEGSKQPQDFGVNAHFGGRASVNFGAPLWDALGLGVQAGTSINATANAVQVVERVEGTTSRTQNFTTVGVFQRTDGGLVWALGYDFLYQDSYDNFALGQWRGRLGYHLSRANEAGVQAAVRENADAGQFNGGDVLLRPITQGSVYWRHTWTQGAQAACWMGVAEGHSEANYALGDLPRQDNPLVFGSDLFVPLGEYAALFGEANFMTPMDTGAVDAYLGLELFPWGGARRARRQAYRPALPVANNTSMTVDLLR